MKALFSYQKIETLIAQGQQASFTEFRARKPLCFSHEDEGAFLLWGRRGGVA